MRSIFPSHRIFTAIDTQHIIRQKLLLSLDVDGSFKIYSLEEEISSEEVCLLSHRAGAHKLSNSIIAQICARTKIKNKAFLQKFINYVLNDQLSELLNEMNFWEEENEVKTEVIF